MGVIVTLCLSAFLWVVLWGLGIKAFDGLMLIILLMVIAAAGHVLYPRLPGNRSAAQERPDPAPYT